MSRSNIIIGITGHRNIHKDGIKKVTEEVENFFKMMLKHYQGKQLFLKSPLAEGADRLAAAIALKYGIKLIVPIPFQLEDYEKDFESEESKNEFHSLREQAEEVYEVKSDRSNFCKREDGYTLVGCYVAQTSHVLLSLWDCKKELEKPGGTAQIVRFQYEGFPKEYLFSNQIEYRQTYIIYTPRENPFQLAAIDGRFFAYEKYKALFC